MFPAMIRTLCLRMCWTIYIYKSNSLKGCLSGVMVKTMDCGILVREFVFQSRYYVHFRANTLEKGMNPLILPTMGLIVPLLFF